MPGLEQLCRFHKPVDFFVIDDEAEYEKLKGHLSVAVVGIGIFLNIFYCLDDFLIAALNGHSSTDTLNSAGGFLPPSTG